MVIPDRIGALIERIEAGHPLTPEDVQRTTTLQALDLAKLGEDFVRETIAENDKRIKELEMLP